MEAMLTKEEMELVSKSCSLQSSGLDSPPDSGYNENSVSSVDLSHLSKSTPLSTASLEKPSVPVRRARHQEINVESALANEAFNSFRTQQKEELERVSAFECNQRKALSAYHQCLLKQLAAQHEANRHDRIEQVGPGWTRCRTSAYSILLARL